MAYNDDKLIIPVFKNTAVKNESKSTAAGRPIFDDLEIVEVRIAGNRNTIGVYPAHVFARWITDPNTGDQSQQTYAQRWPEQYRRFKENRQQVAEGTPIEELAFLTAGKRAELKALSIYTAEALARLDGQELKNLGQGGRELKNQAIAYLENAAGSADVVRMASEIETLKQRLSVYEQAQTATPSTFEAMEDNEIKDWIEAATGERPKGNPSHATLVRRADEIQASNKEAA